MKIPHFAVPIADRMNSLLIFLRTNPTKTNSLKLSVEFPNSSQILDLTRIISVEKYRQ